MAGIALGGFCGRIARVTSNLATSSKCLLKQNSYLSTVLPLRSLNTSTSQLCLAKSEKSSLNLQNVPQDELESLSDISKDVATAINKQLATKSAGRLFAVVHAAGKQRKVTTEDIIILDRPIEADIGERIRLNKVLLVGGKDFTIVGRPVLSSNQVRVEATVIEKTLSHTRIMFWYHRRDNYRFFKLHKATHTLLRINSIDVAGITCS